MLNGLLSAVSKVRSERFVASNICPEQRKLEFHIRSGLLQSHIAVSMDLRGTEGTELTSLGCETNSNSAACIA